MQLKFQSKNLVNEYKKSRSGSKTVATSEMEHFVIIVNGWKPLTIITKGSILDVAAVLDPSLKPVIKLSFISSI